MNNRKRNKYCDYVNCSHRVYSKNIICRNPEYELIEDYCKLGIYGKEEYEECPCSKCKHFALSRRTMRRARELKAEMKAAIREAKRKKYHIENDQDIKFDITDIL